MARARLWGAHSGTIILARAAVPIDLEHGDRIVGRRCGQEPYTWIMTSKKEPLHAEPRPWIFFEVDPHPPAPRLGVPHQPPLARQRQPRNVRLQPHQHPRILPEQREIIVQYAVRRANEAVVPARRPVKASTILLHRRCNGCFLDKGSRVEPAVAVQVHVRCRQPLASQCETVRMCGKMLTHINFLSGEKKLHVGRECRGWEREVGGEGEVGGRGGGGAAGRTWGMVGEGIKH